MVRRFLETTHYTTRFALSALLCIVISGCGGGGGSDSTASSTSGATQDNEPLPSNNGNGGASSDPLLQLSWQANTDDIAGYIVSYGTTAAGATATASTLAIGTNGFNAQAPTVTYFARRDLNLAPGNNVCFRLRAYNSSNVISDWSPAVCGAI